MGHHIPVVDTFDLVHPGKIHQPRLPVKIFREQVAVVACEDPLPTGTEKILFVDDEVALADLGGRMLQHLGYEVTVRTSSIEALKAFKAQPDKFDLLLTDMTMPNLTDKNLAQELLRIRPDIPIILCTGFHEMITAESSKQIGIKAFVMKPLVLRKIAETIREALDQKKE